MNLVVSTIETTWTTARLRKHVDRLEGRVASNADKLDAGASCQRQ